MSEHDETGSIWDWEADFEPGGDRRTDGETFGAAAPSERRQPEPTGPPPSARERPVEKGVRPVTALALAVVAGAVGAVLSGGTVGVGGERDDSLDVIEQAGAAVLQVTLPDGREGSAVLIGDDGYLVSNSHVVGDSETVTVTGVDGERQSALVVGTDQASDIALLRLGGNSRDGLQLRDLRQEPLRTGENVLALGSPFGFSGSVTGGIISGSGRNLRMSPEDLLTGLLQTDAAINPGSSGGPLIDLQGRIVGINTAIASTNGRAQGFGFAVPADTVSRVVADLLSVGYVRYARMGVLVGDLEEAAGATISSVTSGSGAEEAGLKAGDIVVAVNGQRVSGSADLVAFVRRSEPGSRLNLSIEREGELLRLEVTLGEVEGPGR